MWTIVAFAESQDNGGAFANLAAVVDKYHKTDGDFLYIREFNRLWGGAGFMGAAVPGRVYLNSPSLRQHNYYNINPIENALYPDAKQHKMLRPDSPFMLTAEEALEALSNANPAAAEQHTVIVFLSDGDIQPVKGKMITIHGTITLALTAGTWVYSEITLSNELPVGVYSLVGARFEISSAVAARFIPKRGFHTPGALCIPNTEEDGDDIFRNGMLGEWLKFDTLQLPGVEVIGSAAVGSTSYDIYLDVIVS